MTDNIVLVEKDGPVAIVTMNRPDALNALSRALRAELVKTFADLADDESIRAVVLTGAGRAFTAGVDLKEAGQTGFALGADGGEIDLAKGLAAYPWPIIGAINGFAHLLPVRAGDQRRGQAEGLGALDPPYEIRA